MGVAPGGEGVIPAAALGTGLLGPAGAHSLHQVGVDGERLVVETEGLLEGGDLCGADLGAVHRSAALQVGHRPADDGAHPDERGFVGDGLGGLDGPVQPLDVLDVVGAATGEVDVLDVPPIGTVAGLDVLGEGNAGLALDGDLVVVVQDDEVAQLLGAGQRGRLGRDTFLQTTVAGDGVDEVVERAGAGFGVRVEQSALTASCHGHTDGIGGARSQRPGGGLDEIGVPVLGMAGGLGPPGAQCLEIVEFQSATGQVQLVVQGERGVAG